QKVDGLYINGSTGENFLLTTDQKKFIFETVKDEAKDSVKLIAQVGYLNLEEAGELGKFATELGYDSLSAVTPFYYTLTFAAINSYDDTIVEETGYDMTIYALPSGAGVGIAMV